MVDVGSAFLLAGVILIIGFVSDEVSHRFGIPDLLVMIGLGILLGPGLGFIPREPLMGIAPFFAALALLIILFESGLNLPLGKALTGVPRAFVVGSLSVGFSIIVALIILVPFLGWGPLEAVLLGGIVGGSSSAVILSLAPKTSLGSKVKAILSLESIYTDALIVVFALIVMRVLAIPSERVTLGTILSEIMGSLFIGVLVGVAAAILWGKVAARVHGKLFSDVITLGVAILLYGFSEQIGGSGAISVFVFGIILGNPRRVYPRLQMSTPQDFSPYSRKFYAQMSFLMRTYFFAYLGIIFQFPDPWMLLIGVTLTAGLLAVRYLAVLLGTYGLRLKRWEKFSMTLLCGRGLAAAVLANLAISYALPISGTLILLTTQVIIYTSIISGIGAYLPLGRGGGRPLRTRLSV